MTNYSNFYGESDPRNVPHYGATEAARIVRGIPASTLRSWFSGDDPTIAPSKTTPLTLSFNNLVEAAILRTLRVKHDIKMSAVKEAKSEAEKKLSIERLFLHEGLRTDGVELFVYAYGVCTNLSRSAQLTITEILNVQLSRIEYTENFASKIYPLIGNNNSSRDISVDPLVSFGKASIANRNIPTEVINTRFNSGETVEELMADYGLEKQQVVSAVVFEEAA